jgi:SAM-dependent methyltransferase
MDREMLERRPEPELMDDPEQARAYAQADFAQAHDEIIGHFSRVFPGHRLGGLALDLGCGPADITVRFARRHPGCLIEALDGAPAMLAHAQRRIVAEGLGWRIRLRQAVLPDPELPAGAYQAILSNSLLHHLHDPLVLWSSIAQAAAPRAHVFVADLRRPGSNEAVRDLVQRYAEGEPEVLRRDFHNSLLAAFTPQEVCEQLVICGMAHLVVETITDRHLIVYGRMP